MALQKVVRSTVIDAPIERVWAVLRDFNSHDQWHEVVAKSDIEDGKASDRVGCVRNFTLQDGNHIREMLLSLSDKDFVSTYTIVDATVPLQRYVATITLKPVTDGQRTFWHWTSSFATPLGMEAELRHMVAHGVYEAGFSNLRRHLQLGVHTRSNARTTSNRSSSQASAIPAQTIKLREYGEATQLRAESTDVAPPGPGEVRIRQTAVGVNYLDVYLRKGWIPDLLPLPGTPGMEAAGEVIDVGPDVTSLLPGDRVAYMGPVPGSYTSVRNVPAAWTVRLGAGIDDTTAAASLLKGITADYLLRDLGRIQAGTRLLVHAAAGGVGTLVCAWARSMGALVMGTVSSQAKARIARDHGCQHVIVTSNYEFSAAVHSIAQGADVIIDGLGDAACEENFAALAPCGHWISLGQASGPLKPLSPDWLVTKSVSFSRPVAFAYVATHAVLNQRAERVWKAFQQGILLPVQAEQFALKDAVAAHERLESRQSSGSLVLLPS
jgi:NADPH:quinone reductase